MNFIQNQPKRLNLKVSKSIISKLNVPNLENSNRFLSGVVRTGEVTVGCEY